MGSVWLNAGSAGELAEYRSLNLTPDELRNCLCKLARYEACGYDPEDVYSYISYMNDPAPLPMK